MHAAPKISCDPVTLHWNEAIITIQLVILDHHNYVQNHLDDGNR